MDRHESGRSPPHSMVTWSTLSGCFASGGGLNHQVSKSGFLQLDIRDSNPIVWKVLPSSLSALHRILVMLTDCCRNCSNACTVPAPAFQHWMAKNAFGGPSAMYSVVSGRVVPSFMFTCSANYILHYRHSWLSQQLTSSWSTLARMPCRPMALVVSPAIACTIQSVMLKQ